MITKEKFFSKSSSWTYSEPSETSKMGLFAIIDVFQPLIICTKRFLTAF